MVLRGGAGAGDEERLCLAEDVADPGMIRGGGREGDDDADVKDDGREGDDDADVEDDGPVGNAIEATAGCFADLLAGVGAAIEYGVDADGDEESLASRATRVGIFGGEGNNSKAG